MLVTQARALVPGAAVGRLVLSATDRAATLVLMTKAIHGDFDTSDEVLLYFDQYSGDLVARRSMRISAARPAIRSWPRSALPREGLRRRGGQGIVGDFRRDVSVVVVRHGSVMWWNRAVRRRHELISR
jgi:hypothetical protein